MPGGCDCKMLRCCSWRVRCCSWGLLCSSAVFLVLLVLSVLGMVTGKAGGGVGPGEDLSSRVSPGSKWEVMRERGFLSVG